MGENAVELRTRKMVEVCNQIKASMSLDEYKEFCEGMAEHFMCQSEEVAVAQVKQVEAESSGGIAEQTAPGAEPRVPVGEMDQAED